MSICHKIRLYSSTHVKLAYSKKHVYCQSECLDNKLGQDIIPTNIVIKLDNDQINMISK